MNSPGLLAATQTSQITSPASSIEGGLLVSSQITLTASEKVFPLK